jgi:hypothetical protein
MEIIIQTIETLFRLVLWTIIIVGGAAIVFSLLFLALSYFAWLVGGDDLD